MTFSQKTLLLLCAMTTPVTAWCDTSLEIQPSSYRATIGIKVNSIDFDVYNKNSTDPNGTLSEDFSLSPIFVLGSPYKYIQDSNWGNFMEYSFSGFKLNQQVVNDELVDLGTSVDGYYVFVTPTIFYSFDEKYLNKNNRQKLIAGLGIGLGYLKADGDIIFTETTQELLAIDISGAALAISMFIDYRFGNFVTRISGGLTSHSKNHYDYDAFGFEWDFSYIFDL